METPKKSRQSETRSNSSTDIPANQVYADSDDKKQLRLEFAEIVEMQDGSLQLAVNGRSKKGKQQQQKTTIPKHQDQQRVIPVSEALRAQHEESYRVYGMISSMSPVFRMVTGQIYKCSICGDEKFVEFEIPVVHPSPKHKKFLHCEERMEPGDCEFITALNVELMDADSFSDIERLTVTLFEENTEGVHIGERVVVEGDLHITQNGGRHSKFLPILHADSIHYEARDEVKLTDSDIDSIKRFVKIIVKNKGEGKLIESLAKMVSPDIIGHTFVKEGMLYVAAYSGYDAGNIERIRINAMLVGPAGLAKTKLLKSTVRLVPNSRYESGQHSSGKSLTAMIAKEDEMHILRLGPVPLARGAIIAINEAGRMSEDDQAMLLDAMEEGSFHMNKYGFNVKIRADASVIMSANPRSSNWINIGYDDKVDLNEIPALKELLDRTDLIFAVKAVRDEQIIRDYAEKKSDMEDRKIANYDLFLRKYIAYAKTVSPKISDEAKNILNEAYVQCARRFGTPRIRNTLFRLVRAIARLKLKRIADEDDARETISYFNAMIQQFTDVMTVPESPHDVAFRMMADVLKNSKLAIVLSDLARMASEQNAQVAAYLKAGHDIGSNRKLRRLHQSLINHSQIKQVQDRPIALQWFDETGSYNNLSDVSDVSDSQKSVGEKNNDNLGQNKATKNSAAQTKNPASERSDTSDRKPKQLGREAFQAWNESVLAFMRQPEFWIKPEELRDYRKHPGPNIPKFEVPCPYEGCDFKAASTVPDAAIFATAVTHGFLEHPGQDIGSMLREIGYAIPGSANNGDGNGRGDEKQRQNEGQPNRYFACPQEGCEEQLEGPVKLLEHIHQHCPERENGTREWLQVRGLLPEEHEEEEHRS